jgi:ribose-phosphate pyrophosphokinase
MMDQKINIDSIMIFTGNSNRELAAKVCEYLNIPGASMTIEKFADGEIHLKSEVSVRGKEIYILQSTNPPTDNLFELLIMIDSLKRASAEKITVIIPYYGYARQDRKTRGREPITAKLVSNLIETAGADRMISIDLHAGQIQGFFDIPSDNLTASLLFARTFIDQKLQDIVIVSPDVGGVNRAKHLSNMIHGSTLAICSKNRIGKDTVESIKLIGDVSNKTAIIVDDIISTASTLRLASLEIEKQGAKAIYACATHGIFIGNSLENLNNCPIQKVLVTDTVKIDIQKLDICKKIQIISVAPLIGEVIRRIQHQDSVSEVFEQIDPKESQLF